MIKKEIIKPYLKHFINSLRDIGYTFEIAVADILDNSISAGATEIKIYAVPQPEIVFSMLDNGSGMSEQELIEAMRLATKGSDAERNAEDLGRFGLGLKTASFSQCKKLTVISKRNNITSIRQWDLDHIANSNEWELITPDLRHYRETPLFNELITGTNGTLVIWENVDKHNKSHFSDNLNRLNNHLSLVFHRFLEGTDKLKRIKITVNNHPLKPFDPFNSKHDATFQNSSENIQFHNESIIVTPYILPHHSKLSQEEWDMYGTEDGYIKSQGFYLYRANRLLIYGTWWGLHKASDANKLVRIKIDIPNNQDSYWGIDIKKSTASPLPELKSSLKRIALEAIKIGFKPFYTRGRKINDKRFISFWSITPKDGNFYFSVNKDHPLYELLIKSILIEDRYLFDVYLKGLQTYLPLDTIQSKLLQDPHQITQDIFLSDKDICNLTDKLMALDLDKEDINRILKTEIFKNNKEMFSNE